MPARNSAANARLLFSEQRNELIEGFPPALAQFHFLVFLAALLVAVDDERRVPRPFAACLE